MQQLASITIKVTPDDDIILYHEFIGLHNTPGTIISGTYKNEIWEKGETSNIHIVARTTTTIGVNGKQGRDITVVLLHPLLPKEYIAVEQDAGDGILAITPIICPQEEKLTKGMMYFFKK